MSTFLCRFQVWFALHTFQVSHWHIFPQSEVQLPLIEPDWAAYCVWGVLNRSSWCLSQFPEQCVCKNPACVTSAPFSLASKVAAVQRGRGSPWKHLLQHRPCPQSALFQPVWSNCWRSVSTYPPPFFFPIWTSLCCTACFKLGIRTLKKTLRKFQVDYGDLSS